MSCCKNGVFLPWVKDCEGELRPIRHGEVLRVGGQIVPTQILLENLTIYMTIGGNDSSGTGTSDKPFKTLHRCQEEVLKYIPGNYEIHIDVGIGTFSHESTFKPSWIYGAKIYIDGKRNYVSSAAVTNIRDWPSSVTSNLGITGTAAVNDTPAASGDTSLTIDTVSLDTTDTDLVPIWAQFTIASETNSPIHTVLTRVPTSTSPTTDITFTPETNTGVLNDAIITFLPRPANEDYYTSEHPKLQYFDCDVTLTGTDAAIGHFVQVYKVTGSATFKEALVGQHKIIDWNPGTEVATIRVFQRSGVAAVPVGTLSISESDVINSVITFDEAVDDHGVVVEWVHGGNWTAVVIDGNQNQFDTRRGLLVTSGGIFTNVSLTGINNFSLGIEIYAGGYVKMSGKGHISKIQSLGASVAGGGLRYIESRMNACGYAAAWVKSGGVFTGSDSYYVACSQYRCLLVERTGDADTHNSYFYYEDSVTGPLSAAFACLDCRSLSRIEATSATFVGYTDTKYTTGGGQINP